MSKLIEKFEVKRSNLECHNLRYRPIEIVTKKRVNSQI